MLKVRKICYSISNNRLTPKQMRKKDNALAYTYNGNSISCVLLRYIYSTTQRNKVTVFPQTAAQKKSGLEQKANLSAAI